MGIFQEAEKFAVEAIEKSQPGSPDVFHALRTAEWVKVLKPEADEALRVAALLHDIERAFHGDWKKGSDDPAALEKHQKLSADEAEKFLRSRTGDEAFVAKVRHLIEQHETGGDDEQNILCDADCLAYFEEKAVRNARRYRGQERPKEEFVQKLDYVFARISSERARKIADKWRSEALAVLEDK